MKYTLQNLNSVAEMTGYIWKSMLTEGWSYNQMQNFSILSMRGGFENCKNVCNSYIELLNK